MLWFLAWIADPHTLGVIVLLAVMVVLVRAQSLRDVGWDEED